VCLSKTDAIDGETLLRTLMAWQRGETRVCAMTVPPSPSEEDRRRISRERATLLWRVVMKLLQGL
jgi:transposase